MNFTRQTATHPDPNLTQEAALEALYSHPSFVRGTKIASINKVNGHWKASLLVPKKAEFPPKEDPVDAAEDSAPKKESPDSDSDDDDAAPAKKPPAADSDSDDPDSDSDSPDGLPGLPKSDSGPDDLGKDDGGGDLKEVVHLLHQLVQQLGPAAGGPPGAPPGPPGHAGPPHGPPDGPPPGPPGAGGPPGGPAGPPPPPGAGGPPGGGEPKSIRPESMKPGRGQVPVGSPAFAPSFSSFRVGSNEWAQTVGRKRYFEITSDPTGLSPKQAAANINSEWNQYGYQLSKLRFDEASRRYHAIVSHIKS